MVGYILIGIMLGAGIPLSVAKIPLGGYIMSLTGIVTIIVGMMILVMQEQFDQERRESSGEEEDDDDDQEEDDKEEEKAKVYA
ncbi:hypothetical protein ACFQE1_00400 [Halobium palmae]|uniref:Uncharacterized protein n=1 Tax=Halobium palmae TaxID=1776492 RepID=A0ABD5RU32_9EURY